jgi:hypothetical protein
MAPVIPAALGLASMRQIYDFYLPRSLDAQSRGGNLVSAERRAVVEPAH